VIGKIAGMAALVLMASVSAVAAPRLKSPLLRPNCRRWQDSFQVLDTSRWTISNGSAPGSSTANVSAYEAANVQLVAPGVVRIALTQVANPGSTAVSSYGGSIRTKQLCGYGTYSWTMKMSSTALCADAKCVGQAVSGSVSAGFVYVNNSETEIDFEMEGQAANSVHLVNWLNTNPKTDPVSTARTSYLYTPFNPIDGQHVYKFVWTKGKISYYVDGNLIVTQTTNVPSAPAYYIINHWGTNSTHWGGKATTGITRYLYVTQASFIPVE
jgi:endo-1,3-1,4-beta-glycanase ExoK